MEPVKLASGIGGHGPQILYPGGRQPPGHPVGTQVVHPATTRPHEGSPYKETVSPPMVSRGGPYPSYGSVMDGGHGAGAPRYLQQPTYLTYQRDSHYARSMSDRPALLPHSQRRPSIMQGYAAGYTRDMMPQVLQTSTIPMNPSLDVSACKKIKLSQPVKSDVRGPLIVDTDSNHSRESSYYPQVEAISPTLPPDPRDESPFHSIKEDLVKQIEQVDKEISLMESSITNFKKKEKDLVAAALKGDTAPAQESDDAKEAKHQSTAQIIYAENRKKAEEGHNSLVKLIPQSDLPRVLPLYHQPSDAEVYQENKRKYATFKQHLLEYFKRKHEAKSSREQQLAQTYSKLMSEWMKRVDKIENSKKHKEKVGKNRELFEKVFPELRKQREDKERFSRVGARVKSDAEMEEIIDGLQDQENEDKKMRAYAVVPPILLDEKSKCHRYINKNGSIEDPIGEYKEHKNVNIWSDHENEIFREKYLQHPKNFVVISSYLERKSVNDCIQNYYLTKKKENYKLLVKRRMRRPRNKGSSQPSVEALVAINSSSGVTTRGSAAAQKEMQKNGNSYSVGMSSGANTLIKTSAGTLASFVSNSISEETSITINGAGISISSQPITNQSWTQNSACGSGDSAVTTDDNTNVVIASDSVSVCPSGGSSSNVATGATVTITSTSSAPHAADTAAHINQEVREKDKENLSQTSEKFLRRERIKKDGERSEMDTSDEENLTEHGCGGPHDCIICQIRLEHFGQSRRVTPRQAVQYGLNEATLPSIARVCISCKCRTYRRRVIQCPIPTCTTAKWRVKRLRPFPFKWNHLPSSIQDPIIKELNIPNDVTKSCSSCHNRILRLLGSDAEEPLDPSWWSQEDIERLRAALREVGCHWSRVAEKVQNKTQGQCKSFYYNLKGKYRLDEAISEYRKSKGKSDPPTVTDEEESGSTTSSCDEAGALPPLHQNPPCQVRHDSTSDTASAPSPPPTANCSEDLKKMSGCDAVIKEPLPPGTVVQPVVNMREDNDSSATASADEGQSGAGRDSPPEVQHIPHPGERRQNQLHPGNSKLRKLPEVLEPDSIQKIVNATIEKTLKDGYNESPNVPDDHITLNYLVTTAPIQKKPTLGGPPSNWSYASVDHRQVSDPRTTVLEKHPPNHSFEAECEGGLDLTVKKRDRSPPPPNPPPPPQATVPSRDIPSLTVRGGAEVIVTSKGSPPRAHSNSISYSQNIAVQDFRKSPILTGDARAYSSAPAFGISNINNRVPSPLMVYGTQQPPRQPVPFSKSKSNMAPPPPLTVSSPRASHLASVPYNNNNNNNNAGRLGLKTEKSSLALHGSITHGTPVNQHNLTSVSVAQANRYEMIAKPPINTREGGSITQGTPVHHDNKRSGQVLSAANLTKDGMIVEPRSGVEIIPRPAAAVFDRESAYRVRPAITTTASYPYTTYAYTARSQYSDSQITSRQIIETDYLTSQQMAARRGTLIEKDMRMSPRGRELTLQTTTRDLRAYPPPTSNLDRRSIESHSRIMDSRGEQRSDQSIEFRPTDVRTVSDNEKIPKVQQYMKTSQGYVPIHSQSPSTQHYLTTADVRIARPSASPASVRDATPTPPSTESLSPHDFRSPGVSTPTPPPRLSSVIQRRPPCKPAHLPPPKSGSPHSETERFSPLSRHTVIPTNMVPETLNISDMMQRQPRYSNVDARRESRPGVASYAASPHDGHQLEGIGKQMVESLQGSRYICETQGNDKDVHSVDIRPSEDRRYHDRVDYSRVRMKEDYRNAAPTKLTKETEENEANRIILNYPLDQSKASPSAKTRVLSNESLTAANLIDAIITNQINQVNIEDARRGSDGRVYRREGEPVHQLPVADAEKRDRSPAPVSYHSKEKEIVTVEDGSDSSSLPQKPQTHKDLLTPLYSSVLHHPNISKPNQVLMESVISREYSSADGKKILSGTSHHYGRPPLEITRSDGRTVTHMNLYEQPKIRSPSTSQPHCSEKGSSPKDRFESRSPHRMPPATSSTIHIHSTPHLANDERHIIRIAQSQPCRSSDPFDPVDGGKISQFDFVKKKLQEMMRQATPENFENIVGTQHSRSGTPIGQQQQRQLSIHQNAKSPHQSTVQQVQSQPHLLPVPRSSAHFDEEHAKKRPRLDLHENAQHPPSRPRSAGGEGKETSQREEVADSPQSGEMVIDESPRGDLAMIKRGNDTSSTSSSGNLQGQDKGGPGRGLPNQYSNAYQSYRVHGTGNQQTLPSHSANWTVNAPPPPASVERPQGYEPNVEPVSDDD